MKLLLITAVAEFEKDVKQILKNANVKAYSYKEVMGYQNASEEGIGSNWFGSEMNEKESIMFYVFVENDSVDAVCEAIDIFNKKQETQSHIHFTILTVEKSN